MQQVDIPRLPCASKMINDKGCRNFGYARVYWNSFGEFDLNVTEVVLLALIWSLSQKTGWCWASKSYLAKSIGVTRQTIGKYTKSLSAKRLIEIDLEKTSAGTIRVKPSVIWDKFASGINYQLEQRKQAREREDELML